jgi:hypothetical protein
MVETPQEAYDRGHVAGGIAEQLAEHERHLHKINGSIERFAGEVHELTLAVQLLASQAVARDATVVTTAKALKDADEARRATAEHSWSPMAKILAVVAGLAAAVLAVKAAIGR